MTVRSFLPNTPRRWLLVILLLALLARLAFVVLFGDTFSLQASGYDEYTVNMLSGHGYTRFEDRTADSDLPPLYIFMLAAIYQTMGRSAINVALAQIPLDLITVALVYAIGRRVFGPDHPRPALLAAAFVAFYPYMLFQNLSTNDTAVFTTLLMLGVWGAYRAADDADPGEGVPAWWSVVRWPLLIGLAYGLAALTKSLVMLMLPLIALWWWRRRGFRRAFWMSAVMGVALLGVITPWVARNTALQGQFTLTSTNDGSNLRQGNSACAADFLANGWDVQWAVCYPPTPQGLSESELRAWDRDVALTWLRNNPDQWPRLFTQKFLTLWNPQITPYQVPPLEVTSTASFVDDAVYIYETRPFQIARVVHVIYFAPLLLLAILGWGLAARRGLSIGPLLAVLAAITAAYMVFHPSTRYRMPADPAVFLLSAYGLEQIGRRLWDRVNSGPQQSS